MLQADHQQDMVAQLQQLQQQQQQQQQLLLQLQEQHQQQLLLLQHQLQQQQQQHNEQLTTLRDEVKLWEWRFQRPWKNLRPSSNLTTSSRPSTEYKHGFRARCNYTCQISQLRIGPESTEGLICAHAWPVKFGQELEWRFDGRFTCNGKENLMLLDGCLEKSFDDMQICFIHETSPSKMDCVLKLKVLDKKNVNEKVALLDGAYLDVSLNRPSYTILSEHAKYAVDFACAQGWIDEPEKEHLAALVDFMSPENEKVPMIQAWLAEQLHPGELSLGRRILDLLKL